MFKYIINKLIVPFMTICILLISIWTVTYVITTSKWYYTWQFEKNDTCEKLTWTTKDGETISYDEDELAYIGDHIVDYMADLNDDLQVIIDGKKVFSNQAINHMREVKIIYHRLEVIAIFCFIMLFLCLGYYNKNKEQIDLYFFKGTLYTYLVIAGLLVIVGIFMLVNFDWTFVQFHHVLFPKPESFRDAFFGTVSYYEEEPYINNLLLIEILSIEVFMDAAWIILISTLLTLALWLSVSFKKKVKRVLLKDEI